jgi:hypothetical protein
MIDLPATSGRVPRPTWLPDDLRLDDFLIPRTVSAKRKVKPRKASLGNGGHKVAGYRGVGLGWKKQEQILALWNQTFNIELVRRTFGIDCLTLLAIVRSADA